MDQYSKDLFETISKLRDSKEAELFLRDLLTEKEISEFSRRWRAARMLDEGIRYEDICQETGLSSTTVARISKWLNGKVGGYRLMIARRAHHTPSRSGKE